MPEKKRRSNVIVLSTFIVLLIFMLGIAIGTSLNVSKKKSSADDGAAKIKSSSSSTQVRSNGGAVKVATSFITSLPTLIRMSPSDRGDVTEKLVYPFTNATFQKDLDGVVQSSAPSVTSLALFQIVPAGYSVKVDHGTTYVTIVTDGVFADPGTGKSASIWSTNVFEMHWYINQWRISKWSITDGPTPPTVASSSRDTQTPEQIKAAFSALREYNNEP